MAEWQAAVDRSRTLVAEAIADGGLGGSPPTPRATAAARACGACSWT